MEPYGMNCESCGKKIPKTRLKVLPDTTLCVNCAAEAEKNQDPVDYMPDGSDPHDLLDIVTPDDTD